MANEKVEGSRVKIMFFFLAQLSSIQTNPFPVRSSIKTTTAREKQDNFDQIHAHGDYIVRIGVRIYSKKYKHYFFSFWRRQLNNSKTCS